MKETREILKETNRNSINREREREREREVINFINVQLNYFLYFDILITRMYFTFY